MKVLLSRDDIRTRVAEMGREIARDYAGREPHLVDTGLTLNYLLNVLRARGPRTLKVAALLSKPSRRLVETKIDYVGFSIDDHFVVGYGLDYNEKYRNQKDIVIYGAD